MLWMRSFFKVLDPWMHICVSECSLRASWTKGGVGDSDSLAALSEHPARNPQE